MYVHFSNLMANCKASTNLQDIFMLNMIPCNMSRELPYTVRGSCQQKIDMTCITLIKLIFGYFIGSLVGTLNEQSIFGFCWKGKQSDFSDI